MSLRQIQRLRKLPEATRARDASRSKIFAEINITPLTDIFLVLLVIFMVSASIKKTSFSQVQVQLPKQGSGAKLADDAAPVLITLLANGNTIVDKRVLLDWQLELSLRERLSQSSNKIVVIEGDKTADLDSVVRVMSTAKRAGAEAVSVLTLGE